MHGLTESDYQEELAKAKADGDDHRVSVLQATKDIIMRFEFHHMHPSST